MSQLPPGSALEIAGVNVIWQGATHSGYPVEIIVESETRIAGVDVDVPEKMAAKVVLVRR